jgi:sugar (pentulose or hexulose) kinase
MTADTHSDEPAIDPLGEVSAFCDSTGGWLPLACTLNGTGAVDRVREWLGPTAPSVDAALATSPSGARGLTFMPYLSGERTPDLPHARGTLGGLRLDTEPPDLIRAAVEGVTDGLVVGLEALGRAGVSPKRLIAVGGGANSDAWCQLLADIAGLPVERPADIEAAAIGAARQVRWVVDDVAPSASASAATWEPHPGGAYDEVRQRLAVARAAAEPVSPPR